MNARATRFPLFDSLRAIAAVAVLVAHGAFYAGGYDELNVLRPFVARLDVGVTLFFLISGFLLYRPFVRARVRNQAAPRTGPYAWRRFLRIVPAYWVALTVIAIWLGAEGVFSKQGILYYGFAQVYRPETSLGGISQAWTLCVELAFYALLPLYALTLRRLGRNDRISPFRSELVALGLLAGASMLWKAYFIFLGGALNNSDAAPYMLSLPPFLDQFALGMALAVLSVWLELRDELPPPLRALDRFPSLSWALAGAAFATVSVGIGISGRLGEPLTRAQFFERHYLFSLVALGIALPAVIGAGGLVRQLLASRVLLYLGLVSYGVYLWHAAAFKVLERGGFSSVAGSLGGWTWLPAGGALAVLLASVSYYVVERPALSLKRLLGDQPQPGEATSEPAPLTPPAPAPGG